MGLALIAMIVGQLLAGVEVDPVGGAIFAIITVSDVVLVVLMLRSLRDRPVMGEEPTGRGVVGRQAAVSVGER
jgi:hypothetical protein